MKFIKVNKAINDHKQEQGGVPPSFSAAKVPKLSELSKYLWENFYKY